MIKRNAVLAAILLASVVGCKGQPTPNPIIKTCAPATGNYVSVGTTLTATLTFNDHPTPGDWCYVVSATLLDGHVSAPSNSVLATITGSVGSTTVGLKWKVPTTGPTPDGYTVSRAQATTTTLSAPPLDPGTVAQVRPALVTPHTPQLAYGPVLTFGIH